MVHLIVGKKGTGKTKALLDRVHQAVENEHGNIVFINRGSRHMFDLSHDVRLIDAEELGIDTFCAFEGFIKGILSQNYDITHIFVDSLFKIVQDDYAALPEFIGCLEKIAEGSPLNFTITISADRSELPDAVEEYIA